MPRAFRDRPDQVDLPRRPDPGGGTTLLTDHDVAALLLVKPDTVRRWAARGEIPCLRLGRLLRFRREDLDAWLHSRESGGPANLSPRLSRRAIRRPG